MQTPQDIQSTSGKILRKKKEIHRIRDILEIITAVPEGSEISRKTDLKRVKKLNLSLCIREKELRDLEKDLESDSSVENNCSQRLWGLIMLAKAIRPESAEKIDEFLKSDYNEV